MSRYGLLPPWGRLKFQQVYLNSNLREMEKLNQEVFCGIQEINTTVPGAPQPRARQGRKT